MDNDDQQQQKRYPKHKKPQKSQKCRSKYSIPNIAISELNEVKCNQLSQNQGEKVDEFDKMKEKLGNFAREVSDSSGATAIQPNQDIKA